MSVDDQSNASKSANQEEKPDPADRSETNYLNSTSGEYVVFADRNHALMLEVVDQLRSTARKLMAGMQGLTIQPTELVSMAFVKLEADPQKNVGLYVNAMSQVLLDHLRKRRSKRRGGDQTFVPLDQWTEAVSREGIDEIEFLEVIEELKSLGKLRWYDVAYQRIIFGLSVDEVAALLSVSVSTVESDLREIKSHLKSRLSQSTAK